MFHHRRPALLTLALGIAAACSGTIGKDTSEGASSPMASVSPASLDFEAALVGQVTTSQTITLSNTGNAALAISAIAPSGDFAQTSDCGSSLPAGSSCSIAVTFTPQASGARSGTLSITDDAPGSPRTVTLTGTGVATGPVAHLDPASLDFASQLVGPGASAKSVTLNNIGNGPLAISSIAVTGDYAQTSNCGSSLAAAASCTIQVTFSPQASGPRNGTLSVTDDAPASPQSVALSGIGVATGPVVTVAPTSLAFGSQTIGQTSASQSVTLSNTGNAALTISSIAATGDYAQTNNCGTSLAAAASCTVQVTFTPQASGGRNGTLSINDNAAGSPHTVALSGTGVAPVAGVSPTSLAFGNQLVGQASASKSVTLSNTGNAALAISAIAVTGDYAQTNNCGSSLAPAASCTVQVTFTPQASGARNGTLSITDNAAGSPRSVTLTGSGVATAPVAIVAPTSLAFGNQPVGQASTSKSVTLSNTGNATLTISAISATGNYSQTNNCGSSLAAGGGCTIQVVFTPQATGARNGTLSITDNAGGSPHTVPLSGTGIAPVAGVSPTSLAFGNQLVGQASASKSVTLSNTGNVALAISSIAASGDYAQTNNCGSSLAAAASCTIQVTFTPVASGARNGTLSITDNAAGSPRSVTLTGAGVASAPVAGVTPTSLAFGNQPVGQASASKSVTLSNTGNAALTISAIATSGDYAQTNNCGSSLAAAASCTVQVTFTPVASGARNGTLSITDNAAGSPQSVTLSGTGVATAPVAGVSPASLSFGNQQVGQPSASKSVTLSNTGNAGLTISSITTSGDYAQTNNCGSTLAAAASCTIQVIFTPVVSGARNGTLSITDNAAGSPQSVTLSGSGVATVPSSSYPLKVSSNGRYLLDQNNTPWRVQADAAWLMSAIGTPALVDTYLAARKAQGFNSFYLMAMVHPGGYGDAPNAPDDINGHPPFATPNDFSTAGTTTASEAYWAWVDTIVDKAAAQGMVVMLAYTYLGYAGLAQGWASVVLQQSSRQACTNWGNWLGNRYKNKPNIVWFALGDYTPPSGSELEARTLAIANGIKAAGATQLFMAEPSGGDSNPILDAPAFASVLDMNSFYGYGPTGRGDCYSQAARAYGVSPPKPAWVQEPGYEFENNTGSFTGQSYETRRTRFWSVLAGGTAGDGFGSHDSSFLQNLPSSLSSPGALFSSYAFQLFASLPWWDLRPSGTGTGQAGKTLITAGGGSNGGMDWVTSAVTSTGTYLLAYIPTVGGTTSRTITVDMTAMHGTTRARWWDPATGNFTAIATGLPSTGTHAFASPGTNGGGQNDWVLVLDAP